MKTLAHAAVGCAAQGLTGGSCSAGAIGGATAELLAPALTSSQASRIGSEISVAVSAGLAAIVAGDDVESAIGSALRVERFNRQLHLVEAIVLDNAEEAVNAREDLSTEKRQAILENLDALACYEVRCAESVSSDEIKNHDILLKRQRRGRELVEEEGLNLFRELDALGVDYTVEFQPAVPGGGFTTELEVPLFQRDGLDMVSDFLLRNGEVIDQAVAGGQAVSATLGVIGGTVLTITGGASCAVSFGAGCALSTAGGVPLTALSAMELDSALERLGGGGASGGPSEGERVLASFSALTHLGGQDPLGDLALDIGVIAAEAGLGAGAARVGASAIDKLAETAQSLRRNADDAARELAESRGTVAEQSGSRNEGNIKSFDDLLNDAQSQLDDLVISIRGQRNPPATAIGALDPKTGKVVTATSGDVPNVIHSELQRVADELGGLGVKTSCGNVLGRCAEFRAANELLLSNPSLKLSDIGFTNAIRPRTGQVIPRCENCVNIFGVE